MWGKLQLAAASSAITTFGVKAALMLVRGGAFGTQRIARHLWRMCFALFIATNIIFIAGIPPLP